MTDSKTSAHKFTVGQRVWMTFEIHGEVDAAPLVKKLAGVIKRVCYVKRAVTTEVREHKTRFAHGKKVWTMPAGYVHQVWSDSPSRDDVEVDISYMSPEPLIAISDAMSGATVVGWDKPTVPAKITEVSSSYAVSAQWAENQPSVEDVEAGRGEGYSGVGEFRLSPRE